MFGSDFYHQTIRKYVTYFGTLFNDIYIQREEGDAIQGIKVPLTYGPKDKVLERALRAPDLLNDQNVAITLPRMAFEMLTMNYDGTRKLPTVNKQVKPGTTANNWQYQYNPVPFNFTFTLYVMVKNPEDGAKIVEQILPYFTPEWTSTLNLIPEMDVKMDIPITLMNVTMDDQYEGDFSSRRVLTYTLDFMLKGYIFGPVKQGKVITLANTNFFDAGVYDNIDDAIGNLPATSAFDIVPGLYANGAPRTDTYRPATGRAVLDTDSTGIGSFVVITGGRGYKSATVTIGAPSIGTNYSQDLYNNGTYVLKLDADTEQFDTQGGLQTDGTIKFDWYANSAVVGVATLFETTNFRVRFNGSSRIEVDIRRIDTGVFDTAITYQPTSISKGWNNLEFSWDGDIFTCWAQYGTGSRTRQWYVDLSSQSQYQGQTFSTNGIYTMGDTAATQYYDNIEVYSDASIYNGAAASTRIFHDEFEVIQATASATVANGVVTGISVVNAGAGYYTTPTVTLSAPNDYVDRNTVDANSGFGVITTWNV